MKLKKFNEAEEFIYGNPAFPGEGEKRDGEEDYLDNALRRRRDQVNNQGQGSFDVTGIKRLTAGKETELQELASTIIKDLYKGLIDRYSIEFDIRFSDSSEMGGMLNIQESFSDERYKRKVINLIGQGESKNMMHIIHSEEVKSGVIRIFGEAKGKQVIDKWIEIVKAVDQIDVNRNINHFNASFVRNTIGGVVKVEWSKKDNTNEAVDNDEFFEDFEDDEWQESLLNALNNKDEELVDEIITTNNLPETYIKGHYKPIIVVRGIDFTLLIHESIKGLYNVLSMGGIPKDKEMARRVLNIGKAITEEPEEFKHGPMIAADLRDFLNESPNIDQYPNLREEFWIYIMKLEAAEFLELIRGMLSKTQEARIKTNVILKRVIKELNRFHGNREDRIKLKKYEEDMRKYEEDMRKYEEDMRKYEEEMAKLKPTSEPESTVADEIPLDYSQMSQRQLNDLQNQAIEDSDWVTAQKIAQYIK